MRQNEKSAIGRVCNRVAISCAEGAAVVVANLQLAWRWVRHKRVESFNQSRSKC